MRMLRNILLVLVSLSVLSCYKDNKNESIDFDVDAINSELREEVQQAKSVFKHLYLPIEMSNMFKDIETDYTTTYLEDPGKVEKIVFSNEIALALGMFGADLGYVRLYEQWNTANSYFSSLQTLAHKIGIDHNVYIELSKYFDKPIYSKDTLEMLANKVYMNVDFHLRQNGRDRASALVILGGWLEAVHIATKMYKDEGNNKEILLQKILEQQASLNSVINLMISVEEDELISNYINQLKDIENLLKATQATNEKYLKNTEEIYLQETLFAYINKIEVIIDRFKKFKY